jgi:hypothetical protein
VRVQCLGCGLVGEQNCAYSAVRDGAESTVVVFRRSPRPVDLRDLVMVVIEARTMSVYKIKNMEKIP